jgi:eukaryotic-like serine/threonine-protein kinase
VPHDDGGGHLNYVKRRRECLFAKRGLDFSIREGCMALHTRKETLRVIGNWELLEKIAESGMGTVYRARDRDSGDVVAIKVLPPFQAGKGEAYQRFARECQILSALKDPHVVRAIDFGMEGYNPYLVMEHVEGETLGERIIREGRIPEDKAIRIIAEVAEALGRVHARGLVHRNVKPDSILLTPDGQTKLTDLCLVREVASREALTRDGTFLGTPNFLAPEHFRTAGKPTRRGDIYALGATLYTAVTGEPPFASCTLIDMCARKLRNELTPPKQLVPGLSVRINLAIRQAMSAQPDLRPSTCEDFVESLRREVAEEPSTAANAAQPQVLPIAVAAPARATWVPNQPSQAEMIVPADDGDEESSGWLWWVVIASATAFAAGLFLLSHIVHAGPTN